MSATEYWTGHAIDPRTVAIEEAVQRIERELQQRFDAVQRIAIANVLEGLADEAAWHHKQFRRGP